MKLLMEALWVTTRRRHAATLIFSCIVYSYLYFVFKKTNTFVYSQGLLGPFLYNFSMKILI